MAYSLQCGVWLQTLSFNIGEKIHLSGEIVNWYIFIKISVIVVRILSMKWYMNLIDFRRIDIVYSNNKFEYNLLKFRFFSMDKVNIDLLDKKNTLYELKTKLKERIVYAKKQFCKNQWCIGAEIFQEKCVF